MTQQCHDTFGVGAKSTLTQRIAFNRVFVLDLSSGLAGFCGVTGLFMGGVCVSTAKRSLGLCREMLVLQPASRKWGAC
eukprot:1938889-Amphidinium_carterae.1